jgi:hypothetical protein
MDTPNGRTTRFWLGRLTLAAWFLHRTPTFWSSLTNGRQLGLAHAGIVYGHQLQITIGQAIRDLELIAQIMEGYEMANRVEFLPLR